MKTLKERELLFTVTKKDFTRQTFRAGGNGGQHQNKTDSGVRLIHNDSGAIGVSRDGKSQHANQKTAFQRLISSDKFKTWHKIKSAEMAGTRKTKEQLLREVEEDICEKNLKIEIVDIKGGKK